MNLHNHNVQSHDMSRKFSTISNVVELWKKSEGLNDCILLKCVSVSLQSNLQSDVTTTAATKLDFPCENVCVIRVNSLLICKIEIADLLLSWINNYTALPNQSMNPTL